MTVLSDTQSTIERVDFATIPRPAEIPPGLTGMPKRVGDILIAITTAVALAPLMLLIAILIKIQDGGPVFFRQTRCGLGGESFLCYKFRTMIVGADYMLSDTINMCPNAMSEWQRSQKIRNDPRTTGLGRFLRRSSLDELPQLLNILLGDMSVVGPRPVTYGELARYGKDLPYYTAARPGVTGLWQVNGRNNTTYKARVAFDVTYTKTWSMPADLKILLRSVPTILTCKGAY